jgi:hypothetical protein
MWATSSHLRKEAPTPIAPHPLTPPWFLIRSSMTLATRANVGLAHHKDFKSVIHTTKPCYEIKKIYEGIEFHTSSSLHPYYFLF